MRITSGLISILISSVLWSQSRLDESKVVKVLSFNILHGATTKGNFDLRAIAKVINDANPDFVALQEVDFKTNRAKNYDLATELGWRTKMTSLFGKAMNYDGGKYGEGILSKYTLLSSRNVTLPHTSGTSENEPRAALEIVTILPSGDIIAFVDTHLDHLEGSRDRVLQANKINEVFSSNRYPTLLAGDLKNIPNSEPINILEEIWTASYDKNTIKPTFPSDNPTNKIDYVMFLPKDRWRIIETEVIQGTIASDHCTYLVAFELLSR